MRFNPNAPQPLIVDLMPLRFENKEFDAKHHIKGQPEFDKHFGHCFAEVEQIKLGAFKTAAPLPGFDMDSCVYDAIGAMMATTTQNAHPPEAVHWLAPPISRVKNKGTKLGQFIKSTRRSSACFCVCSAS